METRHALIQCSSKSEKRQKRKSEGKGQEGEKGRRNRLKVSALEHHRSDQPVEVGQREQLPQPLCPNRHPPKWKHESRQQKRRKKEKEGQLHGLHLRAGKRGDRIAKEDQCQNEQKYSRDQKAKVSDERHIKQ